MPSFLKPTPQAGRFHACLSGVLQVMITGLPEFPMCRPPCISSVSGTSRSGIDNEGRTNERTNEIESDPVLPEAIPGIVCSPNYKLGLGRPPVHRELVRFSYIYAAAMLVCIRSVCIFNYFRVSWPEIGDGFRLVADRTRSCQGTTSFNVSLSCFSSFEGGLELC